MNILNRIDKAVEFCCKVMLTALFFIIVASALLQVITRTFNQSQTWTEELCRYCMVWLTMIGSGVAIKTHGHIAVDILKNFISKKTADRIEILNIVLEVAFSVILLYYGWALCMRNMSQTTPGLGIPMGAVYLSMPVGGAIILFNTLMQFIGMLTHREEAT